MVIYMLTNGFMSNVAAELVTSPSRDVVKAAR